MPAETLRPNAAGDECNIDSETGAACPNHWQNVDEVVADSDTTEVHTRNALYLRDLYNIENHSAGSGTINSITVYVYGGSPWATPDQACIKIAIKSGQGAGAPDTVSESVEKTVTQGYVLYSNQWSINPKTSVAWTWDEIDTLQAGVALRSSRSAGGGDAVCSQVYVEVDYGTPFSIGVSVSASGLKSFSKTAAVAIGELVSASVAGAFTRSATVIVGVLVTATGTTQRAVSSSVIVGEVVTASVTGAFTRAASVIIGVVAVASKTIALTRAASVIEGVVVTASSSMQHTVSASIAVGELVAASVVGAFTRASSVIVGVLVTASGARTVLVSASVAIGELVTAAKALASTRSSSNIIGVWTAPTWVSPTGFVDSGASWTDEALAYDGDTGTFAYNTVGSEVFGDYLEFTFNEQICNYFRAWGNSSHSLYLDVDVWDGSWHDAFEGNFATGRYLEKAFAQRNITSIRVRTWSDSAGTVGINEIQVGSMSNYRTAALTRASSVIEGVLVTATATKGFIRNAAVSIGEAVTASKVLAAIRSASVAIGELVSATKLLAAIRSASVSIGEVVTATVTPNYVKSAAVKIGEAVSASKLATLTRSASVQIGEVVTASGVKAFSIASAVAIGLAVSATGGYSRIKNASVVIGVSVYASFCIVVNTLIIVPIGRLAQSRLAIGALSISRQVISRLPLKRRTRRCDDNDL